MARTYPTALIGFGKMAQGYAQDQVMARYYPYAAHAQVLRDHPRFDWRAVVDPDETALASARGDWDIADAAANAGALENAGEIEVAVLATPPGQRLEMLDAFGGLKAVLAEKPLGTDLESAKAFLRACEKRGILVEVNLWRRADEVFSGLARGGLADQVGAVQAASIIYGNGLRNNGTHMIDMIRMLFGEIVRVQRIGGAEGRIEGPIAGDANPAFAVVTKPGTIITFQPVSFAHYRENGLTVWGETGRLEIMNEGLVIRSFDKAENRAMQGEAEIASDQSETVETTVGTALYRMYDDLAAALDAADETMLCSPGDSAFRTTTIVEAIAAAPADGRWVDVK